MGGGYERKPGASSLVHDTFGVSGARGAQPGVEGKVGGSSLVHDTFGVVGSSTPMAPGKQTPGKQTPSEQLPQRGGANGGAIVQRSASAVAGTGPDQGGAVQQVAAKGVAGSGGELPH